MNIKELQEQANILMEKSIKELLEGKVKEIEVFGKSPSDVIDYLEELGGEESSEFSTNSWGWDWNITIELDSKKYDLWGSGFYGNSVSIKLDEY